MAFPLYALVAAAILALSHGAMAGVPAPLQQMAPALTAAQRFRSTTHVTTGTGDTAQTTVVRQGRTLWVDVVTTTGGAQPQVVENVEIDRGAAGQRFCLRFGHGAWTCSTGTGSGAAGSYDAPTQLLQPLRTGVRWANLGQKTVRGYLCQGYRVSSDATGQEATLWIDRATHRPVLLVGQTPARPHAVTTTVTWSDWNDRTLTVPTV